MGDADGSTTSSSLATLTSNPKLQLPASCDPPTPQNPPEQRVWIVAPSPKPPFLMVTSSLPLAALTRTPSLPSRLPFNPSQTAAFLVSVMSAFDQQSTP
ncbi:MAG: hypothetical protein Q9228_007718 [Teloschistes exilis]